MNRNYDTEILPSSSENADEPLDAPAFGAVAPARSAKRAEENKGRKVAIAIAGAIAVIALAIVGVLSVLGTFDSTAEKAQRVSLTTERVEGDLKNAQVTLPDLSAYKYVSTANLIGPRYDEVIIGDVEEVGGEGDAVMRTVTTTATYKNKSIVVSIPLSIPYLYSPSEETWQMGEILQEEAVVTPAAAPSASTIMADINAIMETVEPGFTARYEGAQTNTVSDLTEEGGTITATLLKVDGRTTYTCELSLTVTWSETEGWMVEPKLLSEDESYDEPPAMMLECSSGDTVQIGGTVRTSDTSARLVLQLDQELELRIDGESHDITELSLSVNLDDDGASLIGKHVSVIGTITTGLSTRTAVAGIAATSITLG